MRRLILALGVTLITPLFHPVTALQKGVSPSTEMGSGNYFPFSTAIKNKRLDVAQEIADKTKSPFAKRALEVAKMKPELTWPQVLETAKDMQKYNDFIGVSAPSPTIEENKAEPPPIPTEAIKEEPTQPSTSETTGEGASPILPTEEAKMEGEPLVPSIEDSKPEEELPTEKIEKEEQEQLSQQESNPKTPVVQDQSKRAPGDFFIKETGSFFATLEETACQKVINSLNKRPGSEDVSEALKQRIASDKGRFDLVGRSALSRIGFAQELMSYKGYQKKYEEILAMASKDMYRIMDRGINYCQSQLLNRAKANLSEGVKARLEANKKTRQEATRKAETGTPLQEKTNKRAEALARLKARTQARAEAKAAQEKAASEAANIPPLSDLNVAGG